MKRALLVALSVMAVRLTAQEQEENNVTTWAEEYKEDVRRLPSEANTFQHTLEFVRKHGLSDEQMAKVQEYIAREKMRVLEEMPEPDPNTSEWEVRKVYENAEFDVIMPILVLQLFYGPDTLALLKECALSKSERVRRQATLLQEQIKFSMGMQEQLEKDDATLKKFILSVICNPREPSIYLPKAGLRSTSARGNAWLYKIPDGRMTRVLEEVTRERLSDLEKAEGDDKKRPLNDVSVLLKQFKDFHGPDTPALLKECALSTSENVRNQAKGVQEFIMASPAEQMTMALEEKIRAKLSDIEKAEGQNKPFPHGDIIGLIRQLKDFQNPNTRELLRECAKSTNEWVRYAAAEAYITILEGGGDSAVFLREVYAKEYFPGNSSFFLFLQATLEKLKEKGQNDDVEKFHAVMLDMMQTVQEASNAGLLDGALRVTLDGYAQSIQREQAVQRIRNSVQEHNRKHFDGILAELDAVPAEKRTDLSKRFKLAPLPQ